MTRMRSLNLFFLFLSNFLLHVSAGQQLLCRDGKGPLLEGTKNNPLSCSKECPQGFDCEFPAKNESAGICCPNLEVLQRLYGHSEEDDVVADTSKTNLSLLADHGSRIAPETLPAVKVDKVIAPPRIPVPAVHDKAQSPDRDLLKLVKNKEVRLSKETLPVHRHFRDSDPGFVSKMSAYEFLPQIERKAPQQTPDPPPASTSPPRSSLTLQKPSNYSCKRQKFELKCDKGAKDTQIVVRWFVKNGMCCAYPYGFCPGTTIKDDITMRTKEECDQLCTGLTASQEAGVDGELEEVLPTTRAPLLRPPGERVKPFFSSMERRNPMNPLDEANFRPTVNPAYPTLNNPIQGDVKAPEPELEEVFPPGYSPEIDEDNRTRVILHSDVAGFIPVPAPDHSSDLESKMLEKGLIKSVAAPLDGRGDARDKAGAAELTGQTGADSGRPQKPSTDADTDDVKILKKTLVEGKRSRTPSKTFPKKICHKLLPFRAMCASGMPSQFTIRWFVKAGMCCSYPHGYCHGESVAEEESIKTKQECQELCLGQVKSESPYRKGVFAWI